MLREKEGNSGKARLESKSEVGRGELGWFERMIDGIADAMEDLWHTVKSQVLQVPVGDWAWWLFFALMIATGWIAWVARMIGRA